jgi:hypothetical protein
VCALSVLGAGRASAAEAVPVSNASPNAGANNPNCGGLTVWQPRITSGFSRSMSLSEREDLAPGSFSPSAKVSFGTAAADLLAGRTVHWLPQTSCTRLQTGRNDVEIDSAPPATDSILPTLGTKEVSGGYQPPFQRTVNWSGYEAPATPGTYYINAAAEFTVPYLNAPKIISAAGSVWPGLGTGYSLGDSLIQAGSNTSRQYLFDGGYVRTSIVAWIDVVPQMSSYRSEIDSLPISPGDTMAVDVGWDPTSNEAGFILCDYNTNNCIEPTVQISGAGGSGSQAEWVVERTEQSDLFSSSYPSLNDFGTESINDPTASATYGGPGPGTPLYNLSNYQLIYMTNCADNEILAAPLAVEPSYFNDVWNLYGPTDPAGC